MHHLPDRELVSTAHRQVAPPSSTSGSDASDGATSTRQFVEAHRTSVRQSGRARHPRGTLIAAFGPVPIRPVLAWQRTGWTPRPIGAGKTDALPHANPRRHRCPLARARTRSGECGRLHGCLGNENHPRAARAVASCLGSLERPPNTSEGLAGLDAEEGHDGERNYDAELGAPSATVPSGSFKAGTYTATSTTAAERTTLPIR